MSLARDSRVVRKLKAVRRAQFALGQRLAKIDFEEDVLLPEVEAVLAGKSVLGLDAGVAFDIIIDHANPDPTQTEPSGTD